MIIIDGHHCEIRIDTLRVELALPAGRTKAVLLEHHFGKTVGTFLMRDHGIRHLERPRMSLFPVARLAMETGRP